LIAFLLPLVADANDCIRTLIILENPHEFRETTTIAGGHTVNLIQDNAEWAMAFGAEEVANIGGVQEWLNEL
jgi:hypothetical protein